MRKILAITLALLLTANSGWCISEWDKSLPAGSTLINDIDLTVGNNNEALDRVLSNYREGMKLTYSSGSTVAISSGEVVCSNSGGTIRKFRSNTSSTNVTFSDIDTGAEAGSTTYYVYANCDASATTATFKISASSSSPSGLTYYKRLGSFYNNSSSDMEQVSNDNNSIIVATGTAADGATVSLPSGWTNDECHITVSINSLSSTGDQHATTYPSPSVSINSSRVVTINNGGGGGGLNASTGTVNYMIVCYR